MIVALDLPKPPPIPLLRDPLLDKAGVALYVKREDLIHPHISGNKWRKLRHNLAEATRLGHQTLLTFGGAYSNHIVATAAAAKVCGFKSIGIIRGEAHEPLNGMLAFAQAQGMELHYLDRNAYRLKHTEQAQEALRSQFGNCYFIPEGGTNVFAVQGCAELVADLSALAYDFLATACGTGGTLAGIVCGLQGEKQALGIPVLKGGDFLYEEIHTLCEQHAGTRYQNWQLQLDFHHGGYAKQTPDLQAFVESFKQKHQILIEPVYTGKLFYALYELIEKGHFARGTAIVALHTGGVFD